MTIIDAFKQKILVVSSVEDSIPLLIFHNLKEGKIVAKIYHAELFVLNYDDPDPNE